MRRILLTLTAFVTIYTAQAQDISDNAIGLRLGGGGGFGSEISYQRALGSSNRLEIDLGIERNNNFSGFRATGIYQWVWELDEGFQWYAGVGGGIGSTSYDENIPGRGDDFSETFLFGSGQIGIEYNLSIPLQLSLDARPNLFLGMERTGIATDIALSVRYRF